jgi:hypothetical protein
MPRDRLGARLPPPRVSPLPVLAVGRDRLPSSCRQCGSSFLEITPPIGAERYGSLSCSACGALLADVAPPARSIASYRATFAAERNARHDDDDARVEPGRRG